MNRRRLAGAAVTAVLLMLWTAFRRPEPTYPPLRAVQDDEQ